MQSSSARAPSHQDRSLRTVADDLLEEHFVEFIDEGVLILTLPTGFTHACIVSELDSSFFRANAAHSPVEWDWTLHFQFELADNPMRFVVSDRAVGYPGSHCNREFRDRLVMVVEVTDPNCRVSEQNDRGIKRELYARASVPFYLLVDQERGTWTLFVLEIGATGYVVHSSESYGTSIELPEPFGFAVPTDGWPPYRSEVAGWGSKV